MFGPSKTWHQSCASRERLDSTIKYVERCQKRLLAAEDAVKVGEPQMIPQG